MLRIQVTTFLQALRAFGFWVPVQDCLWITNLPDTVQGELSIEGHNVPRKQRSEGFNALGTQITLNDRQTTEIILRIQCAWRAFYAKKSLLRNRDTPVDLRLKLLERLIPVVLFWAAHTWKPLHTDYSKIKRNPAPHVYEDYQSEAEAG